MTFNPDESQKHALLTWYNNDNPLHFEPRHPVIALAGEAGELLDLFKKNEYKPNFSWWNCKHCKRPQEVHHTILATHDGCQNYTPLILDEFGDWSYYARILTYQSGISFLSLCNGYETEDFTEELEEYLDDLVYHSVKLYRSFRTFGEVDKGRWGTLTYSFLAILSKLDTSLQTVLDLNYKKLNSEPSNHGWRNA